MAQQNFIVGDFKYNTDKILKVIKKYGHSVEMIVFSELCVCGYPPLDLVERPGFLEEQNKWVKKIKDFTKNRLVYVVIGCITKNKGNGKGLFNSLLVFHRGKEKLIYNKVLLPTYNIFDEVRHFESGNDYGTLMIQNSNIKFVICEDLWNDKAVIDREIYPLNPWKDTGNADLIISINASPSDLGKHEQRMEMFSKLCKKYKKPLLYVNQVGANDDIVFDGSSFAMNSNGEIAQQSSSFVENCRIVEFTEYHNIFEKTPHFKYPLTPASFFYSQIVCGIKDYISKNNIKGVVVGSSGGIDSAVVLALAVDAIGEDNVVAITMPSEYSSEGSWKDSETLCQNLGIKLFNRPIKNDYETSVTMFTSSFSEPSFAFLKPSKLTCENMQARIRGRILMEYSNHFGHLVLSTGNKSETSVGYCTIHGDTCGGIAPISDLYKTEVYELAKYINEIHCYERIPNKIIVKEPSAELSDGQKDTDSLPPYDILDAILRLYIEFDFKTEIENKNDINLIEKFYRRKNVKKEVERILRMVDKAEFKRRQSPPTIRVHKKAFGFGRRLPVAQNYCTYDEFLKMFGGRK